MLSESYLRILFKNDGFLLDGHVSERAVTHKLAEYLQTQFPDWHVDCEYNRDGTITKILDTIRECDKERKKSNNVVPDIIIHQRNVKNNLLVLEVKTGSGETNCDIKKLELFTSDEKFLYKFGLFIKFDQTNEPEFKWFET